MDAQARDHHHHQRQKARVTCNGGQARQHFHGMFPNRAEPSIFSCRSHKSMSRSPAVPMATTRIGRNLSLIEELDDSDYLNADYIDQRDTSLDSGEPLTWYVRRHAVAATPGSPSFLCQERENRLQTFKFLGKSRLEKSLDGFSSQTY